LEKLKLGRFDMTYMKYYNKKFQKAYKDCETINVLQFDECPNGEGINSYIYQDLSVGFLLDQYNNNPELIPYLGLGNLSKKYLVKRQKQQLEFYDKAAGIFTMGKWLADYLVTKENIPKDKVFNVGGGINLDPKMIDYSKKTGNRILFVGRDFERKGGDLVVEAFKKLKKVNSDAELYIAGPTVNPVKENDIDGLFFMGERTYEQLTELYNMCDVFCMPSRFEAYGLVFAEALAFGLPCVARNAYAMKEIIKDGETGYLINSDDTDELADKMLKALQDTKMMQHVKEMKEWYIEEYSWDKVAKRMADVVK